MMCACDSTRVMEAGRILQTAKDATCAPIEAVDTAVRPPSGARTVWRVPLVFWAAELDGHRCDKGRSKWQ